MTWPAVPRLRSLPGSEELEKAQGQSRALEQCPAEKAPLLVPTRSNYNLIAA